MCASKHMHCVFYASVVYVYECSYYSVTMQEEENLPVLFVPAAACINFG